MKTSFKYWAGLIVFFGLLYVATGGFVYLFETHPYRSIEGYQAVRWLMLALFVPLLLKYVVQLSCAPWYSMRRAREPECPEKLPSVSVLIPAWNEEVGILKTIQSVLATQYPHLQVVIINDGSTDRTHQVVSQFVAEYEKDPSPAAKIKYLSVSNGGKAKAMNYGLVHATGEIVITVDADSVMAQNAIENMIKRFDDPDVAGVAGNVVIANRRRPIEWLQQLEYVYGFYFKRADSLFDSIYIIGGAAAAYRRDVLQEMGGFDHSIITEDIEMSTRILKKGYKTRYAADAVVYTEGPSDIRGLCNQRLRWKHGRMLTFWKHRALFFNTSRGQNPYLSFFLLPLAVYAELLLLLEPLLLSVFMVYTFTSNDYAPLLAVIALQSLVLSLQILTDPCRRFHRNLLLIVPCAWLLFPCMDLIEFQALLRSIKRLITGRELKWQTWVRVGVLEGNHLSD